MSYRPAFAGLLSTSLSAVISTFLNVRFPKPTTTALGREYPVATGCFRDAEYQCPLSGDEFEERTDANDPKATVRVLKN